MYQIALEGKNFCTAALDGFAMIVRNLGRWTVLTVIGGFFNFLGINILLLNLFINN